MSRTGGRVVVTAVLIALPPLLARADLLSATGAFTVAAAACFVAMALSLDVVLGHAGQLTLGHGALLSVGAVTSAVVTGRWHLPFVVGVVAGAAVTAIVAAALAVPAFRLRGASLALVTLAAGIAAEQSLFRWRWLTHGTAGVTLPRPQMDSFVFADVADYAAVAIAIACVVWYLDGAVADHALGRALHVVRGDERVAAAFGVDVRRTTITAFAVSGALAGLAGAAYAHLLIVTTSETFSFAAVSLPLVGIVVVGGVGSRTGVALAAAAYVAMPRLLEPLEGWQGVVGGGLFLGSVLRNPHGIAGLLARSAAGGRWRWPASAVSDDGVGASLVVRGLSASREGVRVVDGVDLTVVPGEVVAVVGANGAGKSTLVDAITGFLPADAGTVLLGGVDVTAWPAHERRRAGLVRTFQERGLPPELTVREVLLAAQHAEASEHLAPTLLRLPRVGAEERRLEGRARRAAAEIGLEGRPATRVGELSVGQRRMLEVQCAVLGRPTAVVLDEPAAGLAPAAVDALALTISSLAARGVGVVVIEHRRDLVARIADHVVELEAARAR